MIPFNRPYMVGKELNNIIKANSNNKFSGDGAFTKYCHAWLEKKTGCKKALLTHSCTAALEMAAILLNIQPGDEIIMPSFTFVSTANAFVLRGGIPVFVDIRSDTLNLDETLIEQAITTRTRAIVPVHYAGVPCEMETILSIAKKYHLFVIEDAAQGIMSSYKDRALGSMGDFGAYSFHETKNVISGEGGCLLVNNSVYASRAEIIREKGTDRSQFLRGEVDKYTWQDIGSSFLPGELIAAFLAAQLKYAQNITKKRLAIWNYYDRLLKSLEEDGLLQRQFIPKECKHNAHMYYILLSEEFNRRKILNTLNLNKINAISHYVPLHSSPAGKKYGKFFGDLHITNSISERIIRLPLWLGISKMEQNRIVSVLKQSILTK